MSPTEVSYGPPQALLELIASGYLFLLYGLFVGFVAGGTFEPCTIAGAFDVGGSTCQALMELVAKKPSGANLVHTFTLTTRLEGMLWMSLGLTNGAALKFPALRPGALLVGALGTGLAGLTHMHHEGLFGEAPWHAVSHPFNLTLIVLDAVGARAGQESEIPNFKGSYLGRFPLVSADFWTSDHLLERSRSVDAFSGTRARGTLTLKRR